MPRVTVLSLGGTIASTSDSGSPVQPRLSADELLAAVPGLVERARLEARDVGRMPSGDMTMDDIASIAADIRDAFAEGVAGVVVTQGTDTLEEVAFALDLLLARGPVVVTGAMRPPGHIGADGRANLLAAVTVASSSRAKELGVVVVMNDQVHGARFVRKTHTSGVDAFTSPGAGALGEVAEGHFVLRLAAPPPSGWLARLSAPFPPVALLTLTLGEDSRLIDEVGSLGYGGVVIEALGGGHVPGRVVDSLGDLSAALPVVLASRTGAGSVLRSTYGFPGSETDLISRGLIPAGSLDGPKARVLLSVLLATGADAEGIRRAFAEFG
ncbi:MAG: asparaginase [Acidobacteriota bacterium]|nr:asparaginase [Acidobacteriota bacterium]